VRLGIGLLEPQDLPETRATDPGRIRVPFNAPMLDDAMDASGIDVLVVTSKPNVQYLLGGYQPNTGSLTKSMMGLWSCCGGRSGAVPLSWPLWRQGRSCESLHGRGRLVHRLCGRDWKPGLVVEAFRRGNATLQ
jgi:hypothetical protein